MRLDFLDFEFSEARKSVPTAVPESINANIDINDAQLGKDNAMSIKFVYTASYMPD